MTASLNSIYQIIRDRGKKLTNTRKAIIKMLCESHVLMIAPEMQANLDSLGISLNKTSVYRELDFPIENDIVREVLINAGIIHCESALRPHRHLICTDCGSTSEFGTNDIEEPILKLKKKALLKRI